ncbi:MAG TPA: energy transducer TonB [Pyrinomonadaceae bacterium]|jgi:protein TonB
MFSSLVESGSHRADLRRRGSYFAGTLVVYGVLLACAGVASVFAYNAQLDRENLEVTLLTTVPPLERPASVEPERPNAPRPDPGAPREASVRTELYADINTPLAPNEISTQPPRVPPAPPGAIIGNRNYDPPGLSAPQTGAHDGTGPPTPNGVRVNTSETDDPRPPVPAAAPTPRPAPPQVQRLPSTIISSKIISKPVPAYPALAKQARVSGVVTVEILVDESGRVISATATSGHPLLREAARAAALQARFSPTLLTGQPVKVSGVITYNFVLQ